MVLEEINTISKEYKRHKIFLILIMSVLATCLEMIGIGSVIPLLSSLSNDSNLFDKFNFFSFNFQIEKEVLINYFLILFVSVFFIKNIFVYFYNLFQAKYLFSFYNYLCKEFLSIYLNQPYIFHLDKNSAILMRNIRKETGGYINGLKNLLIIINELLILVAIISLLIYFNYQLTIILIILISLIAIIFNKFISKRSIEYGQLHQFHDGKLNQTLHESFGSLKDIYLYNRSKNFIDRFIRHANVSKKVGVYSAMIGNLPRHWLEIIFILSLTSIVLYSSVVLKDLESALPLAGLFAISGIRLMPAVNKIITCYQQINLSKGSNTNINTPIIISEKIIAKNDSKTKFLISADNIFLNESFQQIKSSYPPGYKGLKLGNLSKAKTRYHKIRNYPENTDVIVNYTYESKYPSSRGGAAVTDSRNISVLVQHSLIRMPDNNYNIRYDDSRVGYFTTQTNHMTTIDRVNYRDFINRWRLEKKDPEKELSEPIKPIVWWIENTTPYELRNIIKKGVESWNIAFEKAGFINAIEVKVQPDTADWDAGDIRYNVLRWTSSPRPPWGGYGPSFVNPRTGEILGSDIMLEWSYITRRIYEDDLFNNIDDIDQHYCSAAKHQQLETSFGIDYIKVFDLDSKMEKELVKQSLYRLVLHEVGHTLGLNHNFKGSTLLTNEELNNKDIVNKKGVCNSVMEYPAINITRDPKNQGLFFDIKPGLYDIWAIQFGYSSYATPSLEEEGLDKILSRSTEKDLAFANDAFDMRWPGKGTDPDAMIYDLASDPLNHSLDKIDISKDDFLVEMFEKHHD